MAINKKLITFETRANFDARLANNEINDTSIVFIKDTGLLWTHGLFFCTTATNLLEAPSLLTVGDTIAVQIGDKTSNYIVPPAALKGRTMYECITATTDTRGHWTGTIPGVTELYDGLVIHVRFTTTYYGNSEGYNTLNINNLGPKLVWYRYGSILTTHWGSNAELTLTYRTTAGSYKVSNAKGELTNGTTYTDGWVADFAYYTYTDYMSSSYYYRYKVNANGYIGRYMIVMRCPDGTITGLTTTNNSTATTKTMFSGPLLLDDVHYYSSTNTYAANAVFTHDEGYMKNNAGLVDVRYTFNCGSTLVANKSFFIVGTIGNDGYFYLDQTQPWSLDYPTTEDNKLYILIGPCYDTYRVNFELYNPIYIFKNGKLQLYSQYASETEWANITGKPSTFTPSTHTHPYTDLTGSTTTADLAIVSNGTANGWTLKTLGSNAFTSDKHIPYGAALLSNNVFATNNKLYITKIDNCLYAADKRFVVTHKYYDSSDNLLGNITSSIFNGNYEVTNSLVTDGRYAELYIGKVAEADLDSTSSYLWTYGLGTIYLCFYNTFTPTSVEALVYCLAHSSGITRGWKTKTATLLSTSIWAIPIEGNGSTYTVAFKIKYIGKTSGSYGASLSEVEMYRTHIAIDEGAAVTKYAVNQTLYGNLKALSLSIINGTASLFLKANGSVDSTAYLPLTGNSTASPMTGTIYAKDVNPLVLLSTNLDLDIWRVTGDNASNAWNNAYGFYLRYNGTGLSNNNSLSLWANNQTGNDVEVYQVKLDGILNFLKAPTINGTAISLTTHDHDDKYLKLSGGTMTGAITASINAANAIDTTEGINIGSAGHIGYSTGLGIYSNGEIWIRPAQNLPTSSNTSKGLKITGTTFTYNNTNVSLEGHTHSEYVTSVGVTDDTTNHANLLRYVKNGTSTYFTVPFATNADTVDGYHETSFFRSRGAISVDYVDLTTYTANTEGYFNPRNGIWTVSRSEHTEALITFTGSGSTSGLDMYFNYAKGSVFKFRRRIDSNRVSGDWETFITDLNYTSYTVKKDGTGASGTWGISISGTAATASNLNKATLGYLYQSATTTTGSTGTVTATSGKIGVPIQFYGSQVNYALNNDLFYATVASNAITANTIYLGDDIKSKTFVKTSTHIPTGASSGSSSSSGTSGEPITYTAGNGIKIAGTQISTNTWTGTESLFAELSNPGSYDLIYIIED